LSRRAQHQLDLRRLDHRRRRPGRADEDGHATLTLNSVNGYTGATTVNAGALVANAALAATPITVNGGSLILNAGSGAAPATVNGGALVVNNSNLGAPNLSINAGGSVLRQRRIAVGQQRRCRHRHHHRRRIDCRDARHVEPRRRNHQHAEPEQRRRQRLTLGGTRATRPGLTLSWARRALPT